MKKGLLVILALALVLSAFPAALAEAEVPTISYLKSWNNYVEDNPVIKEINRRLGINLILIPTNAYTTKLNTMIASDDLPDVFSCGGEQALDLRDAGKLLDMTPYLEEYGKDILATYAGGELDEMIINQKGGIYGLSTLAGLYISNLLVRLDWLENVGLDIPTTLDELYDVMYAFTYGDPDQNGVNDTFGYVIDFANPEYLENIFAAFGIPYGCNIQLENGTITNYFKHENFVDAIKYLNKLYADGLLHPEFATMPSSDVMGALWTGQVGLYGFRAVGAANNWYPGRYTFEVPEDPAELFGMINLENVYTGELTGAVAEYPNYNNYYYAVSAKCKYPEKAIEFINYMGYTEEGQTLGYLGVEGEMYEWTDRENYKYTRLGKYLVSATHRANGAGFGIGQTREGIEYKTLNEYTRQLQEREMQLATDYINIPVMLGKSIEYGGNLDSIVSECIANLIVSTGDIEAEYQAYVDRWNAEGGLECEAEATDWWLDNK